jgi:hypothetical protein
MPVWMLEQIPPYRPPPPDVVTNYDIKKIIVRAKDKDEARRIAATFLPPHRTTRSRGQAVTIDSPFRGPDESTCIELPADDPDYPGDDPMSPPVVSIEKV